ncbi:flagellar filament capping protein FliD [Telluria aromaticivorans]|uniref:Flagellar hook-associated protein 2 n=1 Tax=Telluria aromaticivorans TaxID=2725995 RepID=A0A7Y2JVX5_9BURK|nr:flagellar filament capping protein FliD [Telluria aromaticivorans]NNG22012.1 flagellar filament capping protein FliD [Telluria aromaticivorans]
MHNLGMTNSISNQAARPPGVAVQELYSSASQKPLMQNPGLKTIETQLGRDTARLSAIGKLALALDGFRSITARLSGENFGTAVGVDGKAATAQLSGGTAATGVHALEVKQLAQAQQLASKPLSDKNMPLGTGVPTEIRIDMGSGSGATSITVPIDKGNNTLEGIAKAMRDAGIDAKLVQDGKAYALSIAGKPGAANTMGISVNGDQVLESLLAFEGGKKSAMTQHTAARDALLVVDGKTFTSSSNTVDKAIAGVTLNLTAIGKSEVKLKRDPAALAENVKHLVDAFNSLNSRLNGLKTGDQAHDTLVGRIKTQIARTFDNTDQKTLADIGITRKEGELVLDDAKLKAALATQPEKLTEFFSKPGKGLADQFAQHAAQQLSAGGILADRTATLQSQVNRLNVQKTQVSEMIQRQAGMLAQQYAVAGTGGNPLFGPTAGRPSLFDFMA